MAALCERSAPAAAQRWKERAEEQGHAPKQRCQARKERAAAFRLKRRQGQAEGTADQPEPPAEGIKAAPDSVSPESAEERDASPRFLR